MQFNDRIRHRIDIFDSNKTGLNKARHNKIEPIFKSKQFSLPTKKPPLPKQPKKILEPSKRIKKQRKIKQLLLPDNVICDNYCVIT